MFLLFCPHSTHHPNSHELAVDVSLKWTFVCCCLLSSVLLCYCQIVIYCDAWCCHRSWTMLLTFWRMDRVSGKIRASVKLSVLLWRIQTSSTSSIGSRMGVLNRLTFCTIFKSRLQVPSDIFQHLVIISIFWTGECDFWRLSWATRWCEHQEWQDISEDMWWN